MRIGKFLSAAIILTVMYTPMAMSDTDENKDFAVPAMSDLPLLTGMAPAQTNQGFGTERLGVLPDVQQLKRLDINRDLRLNDFDVKQLQKIIESVNGEKLTGLQITIQFRVEQKNQGESFPLFYDLDRDGMFTPYDVDYFSQLITNLDEGALRGTELIQKYRLQIFPPERIKD